MAGTGSLEVRRPVFFISLSMRQLASRGFTGLLKRSSVVWDNLGAYWVVYDFMLPHVFSLSCWLAMGRSFKTAARKEAYTQQQQQVRKVALGKTCALQRLRWMHFTVRVIGLRRFVEPWRSSSLTAVLARRVTA